MVRAVRHARFWSHAEAETLGLELREVLTFQLQDEFFETSNSLLKNRALR
jgi:hypothetical protein